MKRMVDTVRSFYYTGVKEGDDRRKRITDLIVTIGQMKEFLRPLTVLCVPIHHACKETLPLWGQYNRTKTCAIVLSGKPFAKEWPGH